MKLQLDRVGFSYGEKTVLKDISLTLQAGERIALMGPSGVGKTTLLRLMAGLLLPDTGRISGIPTQGISMVFQENRLLPQLTALDNLRLVAPHKSTAELTALLAELGLESETGIYPGSLSGGMKRRVAIARAVALDSPLLLLDEPFTGLDEENRAIAGEFLLRHGGSRVLVAVTHDPLEAALLHAHIFQMQPCV